LVGTADSLAGERCCRRRPVIDTVGRFAGEHRGYGSRVSDRRTSLEWRRLIDRRRRLVRCGAAIGHSGLQTLR
jgi:hypothetical protein